jgi:DNA polymerase
MSNTTSNTTETTSGQTAGSSGEQTSKAIEKVLDKLAPHGPVARSLTQLIRPAFVAPEGKMLVWGDWKNIEARVNPWLADSYNGKVKLDVFRRSDAHPAQPDIYTMTAADLLGCNPKEVTKAQRQSHGKVPELALGFGGGLGALQAMATTYGVYLDEKTGQAMVEGWRDKNPWARAYWDALWDAVQNALTTPETVFEAGRVSYLFDPDYLNGSLFCRLPCGRMLTYPQVKWELHEVEDKTTGDTELKWQLRYRKGHGRVSMWYGKLCENTVQATAGSLLRAKLVRLEREALFPAVAHTHDDIIVECLETNVDTAKQYLREVMTAPEPWSEKLPLAVDVSANWWLTKKDD